MAAKNGQSNGGKKRNYGNQTAKQYFSQKPGKADIKALKEKLVKEPSFVMDFLANSKSTERLGSWYDDDNETFCVSYNLGYSAEHKAELICMGRGGSYAKALALCVYWLVSGVSMELLFPVSEDDDESW